MPVFLFETETDLLGLGYLAARQPPTPYIREWETAGTAHDDTYGLLYARSDTGNGVADTDAFQSMLDPPSDPIPGIVDCGAPVNAGSHTYELRAAMAAVNQWIATGVPPRQSPRLEVNPANRHAFVTDPNGNALGGIRTPQVQAPVATLSGLGQPGSTSIGKPTEQCRPSRAQPCAASSGPRFRSAPHSWPPSTRASRLRRQVGRGDSGGGEGGIPAPGRRPDPRPGGGKVDRRWMRHCPWVGVSV